MKQQKQIEKRLFMPDCENPSGKWPLPKYVCAECGQKTATKTVWRNEKPLHVCERCSLDPIWQ